MLLLLMSGKRHFVTKIFYDAEIRIVYETNKQTNNAIRKHKEFKIQTVYEI
jgi:hypothetical protein